MTAKSIFMAALIALTASSCGNSDSFRISGEIKDAGAKTIELTYCHGGEVKRITVKAVDGKFAIEGDAPQPALGFLSVSGGVPVATLIVENGEETVCEIDPEEPEQAKIKGSRDNEELAAFVRDNAEALAAGNPREINAAVAKFIGNHRDSKAATALLVTRFCSADNEIAADSLMSLIEPSARSSALLLNFSAALASQLSAEARADIVAMTLYGRNDSLIRYNPFRQRCSLLAFVGEDKAGRDSVVPVLRALTKDFDDKKLKTVEISTAPDSATWRRITEQDSASWSQAWAPGSVAAPSIRRMAVARVPFFIIADSTGRQLHRGSSASVAERIVRDYINSK